MKLRRGPAGQYCHADDLILPGRLPAEDHLGRTRMSDEKDSKLVEERRRKGRAATPVREDTAKEKAIARWENEGGAILSPEPSNKKKGSQK